MATGQKVNTFRGTAWTIFDGVVLGYGRGETTITFDETWVDETFTQTGNYLHDSYHNGGRCTVEVPIAEVKNKIFWEHCFPYGERQDDGAANYRFSASLGATSTGNGLHVGTKASTKAAELAVVVPDGATAVLSIDDELKFWGALAFCRGVTGYTYSVETGAQLVATFEFLYNPDGLEGENFWIAGAKTGTWTTT